MMKLKESRDTSIIEEVRAAKYEIAAGHDFDVSSIIAAARERQETSGRKIIRRPIDEDEQGTGENRD